MSNLKPLFYFSRIGHKVFVKLENMVEEDREFTSQILEPIDELLAEPSEAERQKYIRNRARKSNAGKKA